MAEFMVRVEIFKANGEDYLDLHKSIEALGLKRTVPGENGPLKMPPGTYFGESNLTAYQLREKLRVIAEPFSHPTDPSVAVCQSSDWSAWLKPV